MSKILVAGDLHCEWGSLNQLIAKKNPQIILQCGDFGWWPHIHNKRWPRKDNDIYSQSGIRPRDTKIYNQFGIKNKETKIYWADGNHENHKDINLKVAENPNGPHEFAGKNTFYQRRGSILTLPDGRNVLFFGGADSFDKNDRELDIDWWPEEIPTISDHDFMKSEVSKINGKIDIVVSHTAPMVFVEQLGFKGVVEKMKDPTIDFLNFILNEYRPTLWYFGHFHKNMTGYNKGCRWHAMNTCQSGGWWRVLD